MDDVRIQYFIKCQKLIGASSIDYDDDKYDLLSQCKNYMTALQCI